jgi:hypothetical protein
VIWETLRAVFDSTGFRGLLGEVSKGYNQVNHSFSSRILKIAKITIDEKESLKEEEEEKQKNIFKKGFCVQRNHCATIRLTYYCREAIHSCSTIANNSSYPKPQYEAKITIQKSKLRVPTGSPNDCARFMSRSFRVRRYCDCFQRWWCRWPRVAGRGRDRFGTMGGHLSVSTHICPSSNSSKFLREPGNVNNGRGEELFHRAQVRMWVVFIPEIMKMASATRESFFPATVAGGWWWRQ